MDDERQEWISKRAYGLWEKAGRPHGKDREHWEQAERERAELERVALPEHLKRKRNSTEADDATSAAVASTKGMLPRNRGKVLPAAPRGRPKASQTGPAGGATTS
ncbi:DUF2934 domain-containing protein [Shinella zoogloeoides]|uniref:DUF2934 domain-containing protein n=1 Tax=Shinella zoogloeoides TaxID=352475 RepID=UPI003531737F